MHRFIPKEIGSIQLYSMPPVRKFINTQTDLEAMVFMMHFPDDPVDMESACNTGDTGDAGSIPGPGRSPGEG